MCGVVNMIELENVSKSYGKWRHRTDVFQDLSLRVEAGEFVAIMGPSGSGKSSLLHILGCMDSPTTGSYRLMNQTVSTMSQRQKTRLRSQYIGFVFQSFYLIDDMSVSGNVTLPLLYAPVRFRERQARVRQALEEVDLYEKRKMRTSQLSGGQRQRVAIARAIVHQPRLLLADEPTGNLDAESAQQIMNIFQALNRRGTTIILATHDPEIASYAGRLLHLHRDGTLTESGSSVAVHQG
jgi:putative ABC transport system ATP-binding protein